MVSINGISQIVKKAGDTISVELISFEQQFEFLTIDSSSQNIWEIGSPSKAFFDSAHSHPNAIITDSINTYPINNLSYFDIVLTEGEEPIPEVGISFLISFKHMFDTDSLKDGGFITTSFDHGQTWRNVIDFMDYQWQGYEAFPGYGWLNENIYTTSDTLIGGNYGYSGNSGGWISTTIAWHYIPVKKGSYQDPNQQIVRFNFISDSIETQKEGWMIDDILLYSLDLGSFTKGISQHSSIKVFPNPMTDYTCIESDIVISHITIYNSVGQKVKDWYPSANIAFIEKGNLQSGTYYLKIERNNQFEFNKLIITN